MLRPILALALLSACSDYEVTRQDFRESFPQDGGNLTVDILWVMDDSGSMSEERDNVIANVSRFVGVLNGFAADWQVGVVTTSAETTGGAIVGTVVTAYDSNVERSFADRLDVGSFGDREEQGLLAMELAISDDLLNGANAGLVRDSADLAVIVLSDEDDQSPDAPSDYVSTLRSFKGEGRSRLSAVVGQLPEGCASPYAAADAAERYLEVATSTEGVQASICREDFGDTMKALALNALGLQDTFVLGHVPEPTTIEVRLDGVLLHERAENGWTYDAGQNAVVLDGFAVPGPGQAIEIRYFEWLGLLEDTAAP